MSDSTWPNNAPFALFLSHDVDQIHDREMFHFLATLNHIRRMLSQGEPGNLKLAVKRMARMLFAPKRPEQDFNTILEIEARHDFCSTFFLLHDVCGSKNGPRYRLDDPALKKIVNLIREKEPRNARNRRKGSGCEIGLHGGVKCFNDVAKYRQCREELEAALGIKVTGIRNHLLKHNGNETWQAQQDAGFAYDATFGHVHAPGNRDNQYFPFYADEDGRPETEVRDRRSEDCSKTIHHLPFTTHHSPLLVLPLTVMDGVLFRRMKLSGQAALDAAWQAITPVIEAGGLVSLLWHNNYFNEPEYSDWQWVYEQLLDRLAEKKPWCATGAEITEWWGARSTGVSGEEVSSE